MVTNRTEADVLSFKSLRKQVQKGLASADLLKNHIGGYNTSDLNRVENKARYLSDLLNERGYTNSIITKTWTTSDIFSSVEVTRYLNNLTTLKNVYPFGTMPSVPAQWLDYNGANDIEKILVNIETILDNMISGIQRLSFKLSKKSFGNRR